MSQAKEFHTIDDPGDGLFRELAPGLTTRIFAGEQAPGNVPRTMRAVPEGVRVLDIFSLPRPEYKKAGSGFGTT